MQENKSWCFFLNTVYMNTYFRLCVKLQMKCFAGNWWGTWNTWIRWKTRRNRTSGATSMSI